MKTPRKAKTKTKVAELPSFAQKNWPKRLVLESIGDFKDIKISTGINLNSIGDFKGIKLPKIVKLYEIGKFDWMLMVRLPIRLELDYIGDYGGKIQSLNLQSYA